MVRTNSVKRVAMMAGMLLVACGSSLALGPAEGGGGGGGALSGPAVQDRKVPGVDGAFGERKAARPGQNEYPPQVVRKALEEALGASAPEGVKATEAQSKKIRELMEAFAAEQKKFMEENRGVMGEGARGARRPGLKGPGGAGGGAGGGEGMGEMTEQERAALMERMREMRDKMPKFADTQTKVWAELNDAQKKAVQVKLDEWRTAQQKKEAERYAQRQTQKQQPTTAPGAAPAGKPETAPAPGKRPLRRPGAAPGGAPVEAPKDAPKSKP